MWLSDHRGSRRRAGEAGLSILEVLVVILMLSILATAALPMATYVHKRSKEAELRRALATMRQAIDLYNDFAVQGQIEAWDVSWDRFPEDLEMLLEGVEVTEGDQAEPYTVRFLRSIPWDPMTESEDWGFRSYRDEPDSTSWGGENLYDVYCKSNEYALDGTRYSEW